MPVLNVDNGFTSQLPGLAKNKPFSDLSEKRVTRAVRECLREQYGLTEAEVSCDAKMKKGAWEGKCKISGVQYGWHCHERNGE